MSVGLSAAPSVWFGAISCLCLTHLRRVMWNGKSSDRQSAVGEECLSLQRNPVVQCVCASCCVADPWMLVYVSVYGCVYIWVYVRTTGLSSGNYNHWHSWRPPTHSDAHAKKSVLTQLVYTGAVSNLFIHMYDCNNTIQLKNKARNLLSVSVKQ